MSTGVLQKAVPVIYAGRSGVHLRVIHLKGLVSSKRSEATLLHFLDRQGSLALPGDVGLKD